LFILDQLSISKGDNRVDDKPICTTSHDNPSIPRPT
jgi:hypothetical protein